MRENSQGIEPSTISESQSKIQKTSKIYYRISYLLKSAIYFSIYETVALNSRLCHYKKLQIIIIIAGEKKLTCTGKQYITCINVH